MRKATVPYVGLVTVVNSVTLIGVNGNKTTLPDMSVIEIEAEGIGAARYIIDPDTAKVDKEPKRTLAMSLRKHVHVFEDETSEVVVTNEGVFPIAEDSSE